MRPFIWISIYVLIQSFAMYLISVCVKSGSKKKSRWWIPLYGIPAALPVAGAFLPDSSARFFLQAAGNVWLGFNIYLGLILIVLMLLFRAGAALFRKKAPLRAALYLSLVLSAGVTGYGMVHAQQPLVKRYDLTIDKPAGDLQEMKVVLIADLHLSVNSSLASTQKMVDLINEEEADAVVVAGDIFTSSYQGLQHAEAYAEALSGIRTKYGVYAVYGNHDVEETLFGGFAVSPVSQAFRSAEMEAFFRDSGFITLYDETVELADGAVQLAGRVDGSKAGDGTSDRMTAAELLNGLDPERPVFVLEHEPTEFAALKEAGADLALCGHTHNGQIFPGNLIVPFFNENAYGVKEVHGLQTVVTAGVGYYGPPMRVGTDSEITVLNIRFTEKGE